MSSSPDEVGPLVSRLGSTLKDMLGLCAVVRIRIARSLSFESVADMSPYPTVVIVVTV